jgi:hypothetical protein
MESLERTPTPRELLFSLYKNLDTLTTSQEEFYNELLKVTLEEELDGANQGDVAKQQQFLNELYEVKILDEDGGVVEEINVLPIIQNKFQELSSKIKAALQEEKFGELIDFLESEQHQVHDDTLFGDIPEKGDYEFQANVDVLTDWYNNVLNQTIKHIDKIYTEKEFDLNQ